MYIPVDIYIYIYISELRTYSVGAGDTYNYSTIHITTTFIISTTATILICYDINSIIILCFYYGMLQVEFSRSLIKR